MSPFQFFVQSISRVLQPYVFKLREINKRYAKPRVQTTGFVWFALLFLRLYLIFLVLILFYKFVTLIG